MRHSVKIFEGRRPYFESLKLIFELQINDLKMNGPNEHTVGYLQAFFELGHCLAAEMLLSRDREVHVRGNELANLAAQAGFLLTDLATVAA